MCPTQCCASTTASTSKRYQTKHDVINRPDTPKNELLDSHVFTLPTEDASDLHLRVLESTSGTEKALLAAKAEASAFMHSYVMLKGYETNTREKVEASAERLLSALVRISPPLRRCHEDSASTVRLRQVVEKCAQITHLFLY